MSKGRLVSRPTEDKALSNWTKSGLTTAPTYFPWLELPQRIKKLAKYRGQFAIQYPFEESPSDKRNWVDLCYTDDLVVSTSDSRCMRAFILVLQAKGVPFKLFTI